MTIFSRSRMIQSFFYFLRRDKKDLAQRSLHPFFASLFSKPVEGKPKFSAAACSGGDVSLDINFSGREFSTVSFHSITNSSIAQNTMGLVSSLNIFNGAIGAIKSKKQLEYANRVGSFAEKQEARIGILQNVCRMLGGVGFLGFQATGIALAILEGINAFSPPALIAAHAALLFLGLATFSLFFLGIGLVSTYKLYKNYTFSQELKKAHQEGTLLSFLEKKRTVEFITFAQKHLSCSGKIEILRKKGRKLIEKENPHMTLEEKEEILSGKIPKKWAAFYEKRIKEIRHPLDLVTLIALEHEYNKKGMQKERILTSYIGEKGIELLNAKKLPASQKTEALAALSLSHLNKEKNQHLLLIALCALTITLLVLMSFTAPWIPLATLLLALIVLPLLTYVDYRFFMQALASKESVGTHDHWINKLTAGATVVTLAAGVIGVILLHAAIGPLAALILLTALELYWAYYKKQKLEEKEALATVSDKASPSDTGLYQS